MAFSDNAKLVLERRIAGTKEDGTKETPEEIFIRVANYLGNDKQERDDFFEIMWNQKFMPNSPCLVNAGKLNGQLSACFVLPVYDSMDSIFTTLKDMATIHKTGGGTGFNFSYLRPANEPVSGSVGISSGPVSFMKVYDAATEAVKQGGVRRGANMGILDVNHPDILDFVRAKSDGKTLSNFNISVAVTDDFMQMVSFGEWNRHITLTHKSMEGSRFVGVGELWDEITRNAWLTGDPGLIFIDKMNLPGSNPLPSLGPIRATNPCGEQGLYDYDSCNLGSINLSKFVTDGDVDWNRLNSTIGVAVVFLNRVIEKNNYPLPQITEVSNTTRRIGLGVMGWADMLAMMNIEYDSGEALVLARDVGRFINEAAHAWSFNRGFNNSALTTVAPTGTISIIADCSSGIEPYFGNEFVRSHYLDANDYTKRTELDDRSRYIGKGAHDILPEDHVRMQAAWQENIDNAVSKTINLPNYATVQDVADAYLLAWKLGCKGITVYRDGSKGNQVLTKKEEHDTDRVVNNLSIASYNVPAGKIELPNERPSVTHKFTVGGQKGYITIGELNQEPIETFMHVSKRGSTINGLMDTIAMLLSLLLQHSVPIETIVAQLKGSKFEPAGFTTNKEIPTATSLMDYVAKYIELKYLTDTREAVPLVTTGALCLDCGGEMRYDGGCSYCHDCGFSNC